MPSSALRVPFSSNDDQSLLGLKITLAQEPIPEASRNAELGDLMPMWNNAINGITAYKYIYDNCPYAVMEERVLTVEIPFYVYPSVMSLAYRLSTNLGSISPGVMTQLNRSMDVFFTGSDKIQLDTVIHGTVSAQMPFFKSDGEEIHPKITMVDGVISSSEPCYTSLRLDGKESCFKHLLILKFAAWDYVGLGPIGYTKGFSLTNFNVKVKAGWIDENGEEQGATLDIEIPPCVAAMLEVCDDDLPSSLTVTDTENHLKVFYNTCTGEVIKEIIYEVLNE